MSIERSQEYRGNGKHDWESVTTDDETCVWRLRVPGGWLYNILSEDHNRMGHMTTSFVPMPEVVKHKV